MEVEKALEDLRVQGRRSTDATMAVARQLEEQVNVLTASEASMRRDLAWREEQVAKLAEELSARESELELAKVSRGPQLLFKMGSTLGCKALCTLGLVNSLMLFSHSGTMHGSLLHTVLPLDAAG